MRRTTRSCVNLLLGLSIGLAGGCMHGRPAGEDARHEGVAAQASRAAKMRPGPVAAAAGEGAGWDATVPGEEARNQPLVPDAERLLVGRVAGVQVYWRHDGNLYVGIRGPSSFLGGREPLYVVDGMPIRHGAGGALSGLNPFDIETIEVLRDADAKALYGSRGSNGVVLITTRLTR